MDSFNDLGINPSLIEKIKERSIEKPTAIQKLVIPDLLAGKNIIFRSETGTGKTFAYLLPVLQKITADDAGGASGLKALICAPTYELCSQIKAEIDFLSAQTPSALLTGSVNIDRQIENLRKNKPIIAVGNPGRFLNLAKMGKLKLNKLKYLILDEADRLTASECLEDTQELLKLIERANRAEENPLCVSACSATVGAKTGAQLGNLFNSAQIIESDDHEILRERIEHWALFSEKRKKVQALRSLLAALRAKKSRIKALVFTSKNDDAAKILSQLQYHSVKAEGLFGKVSKKPLSAGERKSALDAFRHGKIEALISTDLASRGLDIPGITHVIALDVPQDGEVYIHRCGRTGRAGKYGVMVTIGDETQLRLLASMEKKLKIRIQPKELYGGKICVPEIEEF